MEDGGEMRVVNEFIEGESGGDMKSDPPLRGRETGTAGFAAAGDGR
jgi:hypothetical protein